MTSTATRGPDARSAEPTMTAMVQRRYGPPEVVTERQLPRPVPGRGEVLVEVVASSINAGDLYRLRGRPLLVRLGAGLRWPRKPVLGNDVAGIVVAVGEGVARVRPGDEVFGECDGGAFAELAVVGEAELAPKPPSLSFAEAAAAPVAGVTALQALRAAGEFRSGQRVLIHGASGGVGSYAIQIAEAWGAEVTAVCSGRNVERALALGADRVIDYTREDFASRPERYDLILGVNGDRRLSEYRSVLAPTGSYVAVGGSMRQIFGAMLLGRAHSERGGRTLMTMGEAEPNSADLNALGELLADGRVTAPIDRTFALPELAEALAWFESGRASGKVVVTV